MNAESYRKPASRWLLSIFFTLACPFTVEARNACLELFQGKSETIAAQAYLSSRFGHLRKPLMTPQFAAPARLVLTNFAGHKDFHSSSSSSWTFNGKTYSGHDSRETIQVGFREDESIYAQQQDFSLGKMVETKYLKPEEATLFHADGLKRETGQVSFLEVVHDATDDEINKIYGDTPGLRFGGTHTYNHQMGLETRPVKTAALYTVSGQVWSPTGLRQLGLPWQNEPARKGQILERSGQHKYVWEWGRAAQDAPGEIAPLYAAAAMLNYIELRAQGGDLDQAYVMVHSFDKVNTRLYSRMHPGTIFPAGWKDANDTLFLVPLREALEKYPASQVSEHVARLIELSGGKLTNIQAIDLLILNKIWRWNELDYTSRGQVQAHPIILNDMSNARSGLMMLTLKQMDLDRATADGITEYLLGMQSLLHSANHGSKYENAADSLLTSYHHLQENSIEISNLDPELAKRDPTYAASVLMSAFSFYLGDMVWAISGAQQMSIEEANHHAMDWLRQNPLQFGITTSSPEVEKQLEKMYPERVVEQPGTQTSAWHQPDAEEVKAKPYRYRDSRIYFFSAEQVRLMITHNPEFYKTHARGLHVGKWRTHYLMSQTDLL